jgi:hypothetical protein
MGDIMGDIIIPLIIQLKPPDPPDPPEPLAADALATVKVATMGVA